ncbi:MAG: hypothetical protein Q4C56_04885 [Peptococcaceae bacterium]|nr:hypothetical protein [Peptococcaceae bacterium]
MKNNNLPARAALDGEYKISGRALTGPVEGTAVIHTTGGKLSGYVESGEKHFTISKGVISGDSFSCAVVEKKGVRIHGTVRAGKLSGSIRMGLVQVKFQGERITPPQEK